MSVAELPQTRVTIDSPAYFRRLAEAEFVHWWPAGMWRIAAHWLDRTLKGRSGLLAVDVGCGSAGATLRLAARPEIDRVLAIDSSPLSLELAAGRAERLLRGDALSMPLPDGSVDVATCFDVWQHLDEGADRLAAAELSRVLRPGGVAIVRVNGRGLWPAHRPGARLYTAEAVASPLRAAGLDVRQCSYVNCLPSVAQEVASRLRSKGHSPGAGHPSGGGLCLRTPSPAVGRVMAAVSGLEAFAVGRLGMSLPVGHSTMALAIKRG